MAKQYQSSACNRKPPHNAKQISRSNLCLLKSRVYYFILRYTRKTVYNRNIRNYFDKITSAHEAEDFKRNARKLLKCLEGKCCANLLRTMYAAFNRFYSLCRVNPNNPFIKEGFHELRHNINLMQDTIDDIYPTAKLEAAADWADTMSKRENLILKSSFMYIMNSPHIFNL